MGSWRLPQADINMSYELAIPLLVTPLSQRARATKGSADIAFLGNKESQQ